jgi:hypothetical protein
MTPFERQTEGVTNQQIMLRIGEATQELIQKSHECQLMVQDYRNCLDPEEREVLRPVAAEALGERRTINKQLQALADLLETQFGISA